MEGVRPLHAVVPLLEMLQRQKHLKTRLSLNGYPRNRCETHIGGCPMEKALLLQAYMPPRLPRTEFLDEVGTWRAVGELGAELGERLTAASGILSPAPWDISHLRTTVECGVLPAHTDACEPRLQHKDVPSYSLIIALQDSTRVTVYPGSHRVFHTREQCKVPRGDVGRLLVLTLSKESALLLLQDLIHHGMETVMEEKEVEEALPVQKDRLFMYLYQGQMVVKSKTCVIE